MRRFSNMGIIQRSSARLCLRCLAYIICIASCVLVMKVKKLQDNQMASKEINTQPVSHPNAQYEYNYEDIFPFTTHDILKMPKIEFIPNLRDACFFVRFNNKRILRCIPKTYIVGFNKCGTTDLSSTIPRQHFIRLAYLKEPLFWSDTRLGQNFTLGMYSEAFNFVASVNLECCLNTADKEFKIQQEIIPKERIYIQSNEREWYENEYKRTMANTFIYNTCKKIRARMKSEGVCPVSLLDASPVSAWFLRRKYQPNDEPGKWAEDEMLTPLKLKHVIPDAKIVFMMRDPAERLWSDYNFYYPYSKKVPMSAEHFHAVVHESIAWWRKCVTVLPLTSCLYDYNFTNTAIPSIPEYWEEDIPVSGVARLRIGLYVLYIKHWLDVFPTEQCLFLRLEDYTDQKEKTLNEKVYPFLGYEAAKLKDEPQVHKTKYSIMTMFNKTEELLREFYKPFNRDLAKLLDSTGYLWEDH